jgi:hypothetical protein
LQRIAVDQVNLGKAAYHLVKFPDLQPELNRDLALHQVSGVVEQALCLAAQQGHEVPAVLEGQEPEFFVVNGF